MATITLSVSDDLKAKMDATDWVNWSSVARGAFAETLTDVEALQAMKKVRELSEISDSDKREIKEEIAKEVIKSIEKTSKKIKSGEIKPMNSKEFIKWCDLL
ncbi:MAG: hypothetical protein JW703_01580 [Candidatus Diapherotrites archaeon]|nr:hypothetical protein [Candidatus Diapherotrites archaeon]